MGAVLFKTIRVIDRFFTSIGRVIFCKKLVKKELLALTPKEIVFEDLSNQHYTSDVIYRLSTIGEDIYKNLNLADLLNNLIAIEHQQKAQQEITKIYGINSGKSSCYKNLDEFAHKALIEDHDNWYYPNNISFNTEEDWRQNTETVTSEILNRVDEFTLYFFDWNKRSFFINPECSHHVAAIYRQAKKEQRSFKIECKRELSYLNKKILSKFMNNYHCFAISCEFDVSYIQYKIYDIVKAFSYNENNPPIYISSLQKSENCLEYVFCIIEKNHWSGELIRSYFTELVANKEAIDITKYMI